MESHDVSVSGSEEVTDTLRVVYDSSFTDIVWSALSITTIFVILIFIVTCIRVLIAGQKTRNPQQRRVYVGSRARPSLGQHEPTIYASPSNLPPPPKYECMAPPSYEEVVGIHYPNYPVQQPITQPIATALAQQMQPSTAAANETTVRTIDETVRNEEPVSQSVSQTVPERPTVTST
ncbi:uncharacterized protein LOC142983132 isoform X2 [Anticarsia gemmatalis]|uniref:uncharacterized protein LOC142983132 isoform X2 n=1 Tax=Anticarsia gemmatalis TaxID=129554 RepID=UPI003F76C864